MDCRELCTGHCIRDEPCDHVIGICHSGCQDGYIGTHCNNCNIWTYFASDFVSFQIVVYYFQWYFFLYYEWSFITVCREGYYGRHCSQACPFTCQTCRHTDGVCACKAGWTGPRCTKGTFIKFPIFYCAIDAPVTFAQQKAQLTIVLNISEICLVSAIFFTISHFILLPVCRFEKLDTNRCGHYINVALQICLSIISMRVYRQNLLLLWNNDVDIAHSYKCFHI